MKNKKSTLNMAALCALLLWFTGCPAPPPDPSLHSFIVIKPVPPDTGPSGEWQSEQDHIAITITFNHDVDVTSVVAGSTLILKTPKNNNAPGTVSQLSPRQVKFVTTGTIDDLLLPGPAEIFTLTLKGTLKDASGAPLPTIKDKNGASLDGNSNGHVGEASDDFVITFVRQG